MIEQLSKREQEIIFHAGQGLVDKEIANVLHISLRTVGTYWERIRIKVGGGNRTACVVAILNQQAENIAREARIDKEDMDALLNVAEGIVLFTLDLNGKILSWNQGVLRVLGFAKDQFVGCNFSILFTPQDLAAGMPARELKRAAEGGLSLKGHYHIRADEVEIWIEGTLVAHFDEESKVRGFSIVLRDETVRKNQEKEIEQLRRQVLDVSKYEGFVVHSHFESTGAKITS
jgi:PAS domain S-box-containing protein